MLKIKTALTLFSIGLVTSAHGYEKEVSINLLDESGKISFYDSLNVNSIATRDLLNVCHGWELISGRYAKTKKHQVKMDLNDNKASTVIAYEEDFCKYQVRSAYVFVDLIGEEYSHVMRTSIAISDVKKTESNNVDIECYKVIHENRFWTCDTAFIKSFEEGDINVRVFFRENNNHLK